MPAATQRAIAFPEPQLLGEMGTSGPGSITFMYGADSVTVDPRRQTAEEYRRALADADALLERMRRDVLNMRRS